jgi:eukaryotic-like serine/threonine-protein kinase
VFTPAGKNILFTKQPALAPGVVLRGRYEVLAKLGEGGTGEVFRAKDYTLDRFVAVKMLDPGLMTDAVSVKRFQLEGRAISRLQHPNLVTVFDFDTSENGIPFLVMEHLEGQSLALTLRREKMLDYKRALALLAPACDGIQHAHNHKVIHRDIKPSNIMLVVHSGREMAKIVDFGIAKMLSTSDESSENALTETGEAIGSPPYMSPEQCLGRGLTGATDQYSLGCVLYQCLTGVPPHLGESFYETFVKHRNDVPRPLVIAAPGLKFPPNLETIVQRMLAKDPAARFASMTECKEAMLSI